LGYNYSFDDVAGEVGCIITSCYVNIALEDLIIPKKRTLLLLSK